MMLINFNTNGDAVDGDSFNKLLNYNETTKPDTCMVMDNMIRMYQIQQKAQSKYPIFRSYNPFGGSHPEGFDNYFFDLWTPQQSADKLHWYIEHEWSKVAPKEFLYTLWYEFGINEPGSWHKYQDWIIEFATICKSKNIKVTSGGIAVAKSFSSQQFVKDGNCDKLIHYAAANRNTFLITTHEYAVGALWGLNQGGYPQQLILNPQMYKDGDATTILNWNSYDDNWHLGRSGWVTNARAKELGYEVLDFVITEGLWDWMDDIVRYDPNNRKDLTTMPDGNVVLTDTKLRELYGSPEYNFDIRGVLGNKKLAAAIEGVNFNNYTNRMYHYWLVRNLIWYIKNAPKNLKGINLFAANTLWRFPRGHDYTHDKIIGSGFLQVLIEFKNVLSYQYNGDVPQMPENYCFENSSEYNTWDEYTVKPVNDYFNVRGCFSTQTPIVTQVNDTTIVKHNPSFSEFDGKFTWFPIVIKNSDNSVYVGWVREDVCELTKVVTEEPEPIIIESSVIVLHDTSNENDVIFLNAIKNLVYLHNQKYVGVTNE